MFCVGWWVVSNTDDVVVLLEVRRRRVWFGTGVSEVESCIDFAKYNVAFLNVLVNVMDGDSNVLDTSCDAVGFEGIFAGLAVNEDWSRSNEAVVEAEEGAETLDV